MNFDTITAGAGAAPKAAKPVRKAAKKLAAHGRNGDTEIAHVTPGEVVVPLPVQTPEVRKTLEDAFAGVGSSMDRYTVGNSEQRINPDTGEPEFFFKKIFSGIKKIAGPALSIAGMATGNPLLAAAGSAIGAGISGGNPLVAGIQGGLGSYFGGGGGIGGNFLSGLGAGSNAISGAKQALPWLSGGGYDTGFALGNTMLGRALSPVLGGLQFSGGTSLSTGGGLSQLLSGGQQQAPAINIVPPSNEATGVLSSSGGFSTSGGTGMDSGAATPPPAAFDARTAGGGKAPSYSPSTPEGGLSPLPTTSSTSATRYESAGGGGAGGFTPAGSSAGGEPIAATRAANRNINYGTPARARGTPPKNSAATAPAPRPAPPTMPATSNFTPTPFTGFQPQDTEDFSYMRRNPMTGVQQFAATPDMYAAAGMSPRVNRSPDMPVKMVNVRPRPSPQQQFDYAGTKPLRGRDMAVYKPSAGGFEGVAAGVMPNRQNIVPRGMPQQAIRRV